MSSWTSLRLSTRFASLPSAFYSQVSPTPLENSRFIAWNEPLALQLGFAPEAHLDAEIKQALSGDAIVSPCQPLAMKYAGHQFGVYNPDLGDGRGLLLGEITAQNGEVFDLHIKGAGLTPYSRMGDGRAVLRSTIREYLCSEAMSGLGIATTRALGMLVSDTPVYREKTEPGALLIRAATSHIRFGHFEHFFYTNQIDHLTLLADKVIEWYWPELSNQAKPYVAMFERIVDNTALMIAKWQAYGFAHGVMNTDNMSVLGQTFDYGPFAFLDDYEPSFICNHSDYQGRYAFDQQPRVALWNLSALAHALSPLIEHQDLEQALANYETLLGRYYSAQMRSKLGLVSAAPQDSELFDDMFTLLADNHTDYTRFFRALSSVDQDDTQAVIDLFIDRDRARAWLERYLARAALELNGAGELLSDEQRCLAMRKVNPKYILRNYLAQIAIDKAEQGDYSEVQHLAALLANPYDEQPSHDVYANLPPSWGKKMEISCSS
ncbi:Uncharacterized conserved protein YdiU, UPF0061 family [Vibrio xiamenensis]|uniref:Protein nucleotidyltransferase YdiU n=1 Tax=Vibrio xiamenensis TaxID=861298 RepID=A0A1G7ZDF3_9VIBR|nr:YdiU family protein [Vibrio xiamenensis]SDH06576.1 Uncharacterized conserved protein YdiU, UPF0061 family [Vibrio xiamenensis]